MIMGDFYRCQSSFQESLFHEDKNILEVHYGEVRGRNFLDHLQLHF